MRRAAVLLTALLVSACGVPQDSAPRALDPGDAPFRLASPSPVEEPAGDGRVALYFVRGDRVQLTRRAVTRSTPVRELLDLLLAGPTEDELAAGSTSRIPSTLTVEDVEVAESTGVVTLGGPEETVRSLDALAYAQIVSTLTTPGRLSGVRFRFGGGDQRVPRGDGRLTLSPLDRQDYAELADPSPSPPPPAVPADPGTDGPGADGPGTVTGVRPSGGLDDPAA